MGDTCRVKNWIVAALLLLLIVLCLTSMQSNSPTSDEQNHISRGYHYLVTGNLDLNVAPPFVNALSGVPLLFHKGIILPSYDRTYLKTYINEFADKFVWVYNDAETIVNSGRLAIVALSVLLGYFVYRWARELWGLRAGLLALFFYVLDPNILAHSQLVTTDLGVACLGFIATYVLWRFLCRRRNVDLALAGLLLGLAQATKLSALLFLPAFGAIVLVDVLFVHGLTLRRRRTQGAYFLCAILLVLFALTFLALWASYRFETAPLTTRPVHATVDRLIGNPGLRRLAYRAVERLQIPFPTYFSGVRWLQRYAERGAPAFLLGDYSRKGWWYYFLIAFAVKTPIPTLLLLAASVCMTVWQGCDRTKREFALYLPVAAFFLATLFSFLAIGYRHILPVLPFACVMIGKVATWNPKRWTRLALVVLCLWYAIGSIRIYPHYLAYFNEIAGGPDKGYQYLVDSNLDWGQDLKNLKRYMDWQGIEQVYLAYFGSAHPDYYGIQVLPLPAQRPDSLETQPSAVYAISATYLQSGYLGDTAAFSWLRQYKPFAKIGYSIFLYRLP